MPGVSQRYLALAALLFLTACASPRLPPPIARGTTPLPGSFPAQVSLERPGMTCRAATAAARTALKRMGYEIDTVLPPTPGSTGEIRAVRHTGWSAGYAGDAYQAAVRLVCDDRGSVIEAATEEGLSERLAFKRDFPVEIERAVSVRVRQPSIASHQPPAKLQVAIKPLVGSEAAHQIGGTPEILGVTPVRVSITNHTDQLYRFQVNRLQLVTEEGSPRRPFAVEEVVARVPSDWSERVRSAHMTDSDLAPGTTISGYVFVPAAAYRRAKLALIEAESEEAEGFSVEF